MCEHSFLALFLPWIIQLIYSVQLYLWGTLLGVHCPVERCESQEEGHKMTGFSFCLIRFLRETEKTNKHETIGGVI